MSIVLKLWSVYVRATNRWPIIATIVPFIPVVALWSIVANLLLVSLRGPRGA